MYVQAIISNVNSRGNYENFFFKISISYYSEIARNT